MKYLWTRLWKGGGVGGAVSSQLGIRPTRGSHQGSHRVPMGRDGRGLAAMNVSSSLSSAPKGSNFESGQQNIRLPPEAHVYPSVQMKWKKGFEMITQRMWSHSAHAV